MKEYRFTINDSVIYKRIASESGFTALARKSAGHPDTLLKLTAITEDEKGFLDNYIPIAINECAAEITRYLAPCNVTEEAEILHSEHMAHTFIFIQPDNFPDECLKAISDIVMEIVTYSILQQWYILVKSDDANNCALRLQTLDSQLRKLLSIRKKPSSINTL